ncbi:MAG TPA: carboxypeptidase regulatory-like domain-containing protein [Pyrinomonadaceae bacterium]|nr:carboxypeptidase regulatory-like domain-containing protein [Pyrinomonadaceae bacterium]
MRKFLRFCFASLLVLGLCALSVMAQSQASTGQISGLVTDVNGAVVANATVKVTNKDTGLARSATASDDGLYTIPLLPPGKYTVVAESTGFANATVDDVVVNVGRTENVNLTLGAGGVQATVLVTAEAIQPTRNESDAVLNETAIQTLPINGRRFQDFVTLTPTAQVDPQRGQISLSGQKGINSNINIDGVDYNQPFFGGIRGGERSNLAFTIPQESIKEFQVVASGYSAEFGRSTGGIVNAVTKSGDNNLHGSAFYLIRPKSLARGNDFTQRLQTVLSTKVPPVDATLAPTQHQFGGSIGGPIKKDRAFWFFAYEQQRFRAPRQILFTNFPYTGAALSAGPQAVLGFFNGEQVGYEQTNDAYAGLGRVDWNITANHRFNVRYSMSKNNALNAVSRGETSLDPTTNQSLSTNGTEKNNTKILVGQLVSNFGSNTVNELRFQWAREDRPRISNSAFPQILTGFATYGATAFLPTTQYDTRYQVAEALTLIKGNHNWKFGGEYSRLFASQVFGFNQFGQYVLSIGSTQANLQSTFQCLSNVPTATNCQTGAAGIYLGRFDLAISTASLRYLKQIGNLLADFKVHELAFFGQDSWRVTPKLTINYGLRVEQQFNPTPEANNDPIINVVKNTIFPIRGTSYDPTQIPDSGWEWGPRLGFAYDPEGKGKMVIRGFAGQYFARTPLLVFAGSVNNYRTPPGDVSTQLPFSGFTQANFTNFLNTAAGAQYKTITGCNPATSPLPATCNPNTLFRQFAIVGINLNNSPLSNLPILTTQNIADIASALGLNANPFVGATVTGHDEHFKNPQSFQFGGAVEREIARNFVVGVDFAQVKTWNVQRNRDLNLPAPLTGEQYIAYLTANAGSTASIAAANIATMSAPGGVFDQIRQSGRTYIAVNSPAGLSFPSGVTSTRPRPTQDQQHFALGPVQVRESTAQALYRALTIRARLTQKRIQLNAYYTFSRAFSDDDNERDAGGVAFADPYDLSREYWYARLDRENQFVANPIVFLPYGFEVSSAIRLRSAVPVNANANGDLNGDTASNDRPLLVPGLVFKRNWFRNRGIYDTDLRVQKTFTFNEKQRLILSAEFFNIFNRMNIIFPNAGTATTTAAGQYCSSASQLCGLSNGPPLNPNFLRSQDPVTGNYINGAVPGSQVFQMQLGARFQF